MGPTGSGKSTFIEALAGKGQCLGISKDQLEGFTQDVTAYELLNSKYQHHSVGSFPMSLWLIDTPGFSDSKISEIEIIDKIQNWMHAANFGNIDLVFYLHPITDTRVPGSKRRTIQMIKTLFDVSRGSSSRITVVTTMWDSLSDSNSRSRDRAENSFAQLRDDVWKEVVTNGGHITRFHNTQESALEVIRASVGSANYFTFGTGISFGSSTSGPHFRLLYQELLDRVISCLQEIELLQMERAHLTTNPDPQLEAVVIPMIPGIKLEKFVRQLVKVGTPPEGLADQAAQFVSQYLISGGTERVKDDAGFSNTTIHGTRLELLEAFTDKHRHGSRSDLIISCWPKLDTEAQNITFGEVVKFLRIRQQDRPHSLNLLRRIVITTSPTELRSNISSHFNSLEREREILRWHLNKFSPPPPEFDTAQTQLSYQYLLDDVDDAKGTIQIFQDALHQLHAQSDDVKRRKSDNVKRRTSNDLERESNDVKRRKSPKSDDLERKSKVLERKSNDLKGESNDLERESDDIKHCESILKDELAKARDTLTISALAITEYGHPPEGYEWVVFSYRDLPVKAYIAQVKRIAKEHLGMKS